MKKNFFIKKKKYILKNIFTVSGCKINRSIFNKKILGINTLKDAASNELTFFNSLRYLQDAKKSKALACVTQEKLKKYLNPKIIPIISENPLIDFYKIVNHFYIDADGDNEEINPINSKNLKVIFDKVFFGHNCLVDKSVKIGKNSKIGNNVIIKKNVSIGRDCLIGSNVIIENAILGDNVIIKSGTLIGQSGFGFKFEKKKRIKFPHIGRVIIESNVQIGSLCTVDRGSLTDTVIGEFTSIDNQVQIAHNVKIGNYCIIAAQSGIAGSTVIGNQSTIGGQSGISGHLRIGNNVKIGGKSGVISDIKDNMVVMGYPAKNIREFVRTR